MDVELRSDAVPANLAFRAPEGSGDPLSVTSPWDGVELAGVPTLRPEEADGVLDRALAAFAGWRWTPAWRRFEILEHVSRLIDEHREDLARVIALEAGKPIRDARMEATRAASTFRWAGEEAKRAGCEVITMDGVQLGEGHTGWTIREPLGVVLAISPFNFPLNLVAHKVAPALAGANVVVLKPASATPLSALLMAQLLDEAGLPEDVVQVVVGAGGAVANPFVRSPRVRKITFTGSPEVGRLLAGEAGLKRMTMELGATGATIVEDDADLDLAVAKLVTGGFACSGQICMSIQRVIVNEKVHDEFVARFVEKVATLKLGDPLAEDTDVASLITTADNERVAAWADEALADGATLQCGGMGDDGKLRPMVLTDVTNDMRVCTHEVFGPLVSILPSRNLRAAVSIANDSQFGLTAGVFTTNLNKALYAARHIESGVVTINQTPTFRVEHMPFGGVKRSGLGREGVKYAIEEMTELKMVVIQEMDIPDA